MDPAKVLAIATTLVSVLAAVVAVLFRMMMTNLKADRDGLVKQNESLQAQLKEAQQLNSTQSEQRVKEHRENFKEMMALSNAVVASNASQQAFRKELEALDERLKGMQEDGKDEHEFVQGLLSRLAQKGQP
jgi:septal ring factor EnvC (AmiA/AmiB activator)